jgi:hypothetical protein
MIFIAPFDPSQEQNGCNRTDINGKSHTGRRLEAQCARAGAPCFRRVTTDDSLPTPHLRAQILLSSLHAVSLVVNHFSKFMTIVLKFTKSKEN